MDDYAGDFILTIIGNLNNINLIDYFEEEIGNFYKEEHLDRRKLSLTLRHVWMTTSVIVTMLEGIFIVVFKTIGDL